jgi:hypothetical protein
MMHNPVNGLTIYGGNGHFSGSFEDDGKHAGHALDHCPFCGSSRLELLNTHTPSYWVRCQTCAAQAHGNMPMGGGGAIPDKQKTLILHMHAMRSAVRKWNKRVAKLEARVAAPSINAPGVSVPVGLLSRIDAAIQRIATGSAAMRVPAENTDPDMVLAECRSALKALVGGAI